MAANLSLASATTTDEHGNVLGRDESVLVRQNVLRIGTGNDRRYENVMEVVQVSRGVWEIRLPGMALTVRRSKNCGCGR